MKNKGIIIGGILGVITVGYFAYNHFNKKPKLTADDPYIHQQGTDYLNYCGCGKPKQHHSYSGCGCGGS